MLDLVLIDELEHFLRMLITIGFLHYFSKATFHVSFRGVITVIVIFFVRMIVRLNISFAILNGFIVRLKRLVITLITHRGKPSLLDDLLLFWLFGSYDLLNWHVVRLLIFILGLRFRIGVEDDEPLTNIHDIREIPVRK